MKQLLYATFLEAMASHQKLLAILIDPDVFKVEETLTFLEQIPTAATHLFVGGSTVDIGKTSKVVSALKRASRLPIILFPGDVSQLDPNADGVLFLSLLSGRNPEYLVGQQIKAVPRLRSAKSEILSTGYLLIEGGSTSAVERVTMTKPMDQKQIQAIVDTAKAGEWLGAKLIYLEAGSGAVVPVSEAIISAVKNDLEIPLIVGGGIRTLQQMQKAYDAGADMVVMGTVFEENLKM